MATLKAINLGLSFLLELAMLAAFAYWGFQAVDNPWLRWVAAIGLPLVVFVIWGLLLAPRAGKRVDGNLGIPVSFGLFFLAAMALLTTNHPVLGAAMLVLTVVNRTLLVVWKQW
jgi:hypothetical protein